MQKESCDIGLIGLTVMGQNLVLNMNDHGYRVAVFNRTVSKVDDFINNEAAPTNGRSPKDWPPMNGDRRRLKILGLSAFIGVHPQPRIFFWTSHDLY